MGIMNALLGTASKIDPTELQEEFTPVIIDGEDIVGAFRIHRDTIVFTQWRLILADRQGITGKKVEYHSIPYKSISQFSVETAGRFDLDAELKIYVSGNPTPMVKEFQKGTDIIALQKMLAYYILAA